MFDCNYHTHTTLCDGADTPEDMVRAALAADMSHLGFSGHMDADIHMDWPAYVREVTRLRAAYDGRIASARPTSSTSTRLSRSRSTAARATCAASAASTSPATGSRSAAPTMSSRPRCTSAPTAPSSATSTS